MLPLEAISLIVIVVVCAAGVLLALKDELRERRDGSPVPPPYTPAKYPVPVQTVKKGNTRMAKHMFFKISRDDTGYVAWPQKVILEPVNFGDFGMFKPQGLEDLTRAHEEAREIPESLAEFILGGEELELMTYCLIDMSRYDVRSKLGVSTVTTTYTPTAKKEDVGEALPLPPAPGKIPDAVEATVVAETAKTETTQTEGGYHVDDFDRFGD